MAFPLIADKPQEASIDSNITESTKDQDEFTQALHDKALQEAFINYKNTNPQSQNTPLDTNNLTFADTQTKENITNTYNPQETQSQEELNHLQQATTPKLYRNTGISYFDRKEHLSLADAFLAKELGINISYVNMDLNANVKKTDIGKAKNELAGLFADSKSLLDGVSHYEKTYLEQDSNTFLNSHAMASLGRKINDATNGFINLSNSANEKILSRNKMDAYTLASLMNGGAGKRTNQNINDAKAVIDNTWKVVSH